MKKGEVPDSDLEKAAKCFNQICRPKVHVHLDGWGNCLTCEYNPEENQRCRGYSVGGPTRIAAFYVAED